MRFPSSLILAFLLVIQPVQAEIIKIAIPDEENVSLYWWPRLPKIDGWHQDMDHSFLYNVNALAPDKATFADAETIMYAKAIFKSSIPEIRSLDMLIERDKKTFLDNVPGVEIQEVESLQTADEEEFRSFTFFPAGPGNWERVSYGDEGEFFLVFAISSRSKAGYDATAGIYEKLVGLYREDPVSATQTPESGQSLPPPASTPASVPVPVDAEPLPAPPPGNR